VKKAFDPTCQKKIQTSILFTTVNTSSRPFLGIEYGLDVMGWQPLVYFETFLVVTYNIPRMITLDQILVTPYLLPCNSQPMIGCSYIEIRDSSRNEQTSFNL
jgi:hypothetical protein